MFLCADAIVAGASKATMISAPTHRASMTFLLWLMGASWYVGYWLIEGIRSGSQAPQCTRGARVDTFCHWAFSQGHFRSRDLNALRGSDLNMERKLVTILAPKVVAYSRLIDADKGRMRR